MIKSWVELGDYHKLVKTDGIEFREYQASIIRSLGTDKSTIVVLPTGLGKTIIAVFAIARVLFEERKAIFLAPTKPLSEQHYSSIKSMMSIDESSIALLTGSTKSEKRRKIWESSKVIIGTPQTIANDLKAGNATTADVGVAIFDECHRSIGRYAYTYIANECKLTGVQIVGLTASPGSDRKSINGLINTLGIEQIEIRTHSDVDVIPYIKGRKIRTIYVQKSRTIRNIENLLKPEIEKHLLKLYQMGVSPFKRFDGMPKGRMIEIGRTIDKIEAKNYRFGALFNYIYVLNLSHAYDLITTEGIYPFKTYMDSMRDRDGKSKSVNSIISNSSVISAMRIADDALENGEEHPKMGELITILNGILYGKRVIVFAQYRSTIHQIAKMLSESGVSAREFIGKKDGITYAHQSSTIEDFRDGKFNVLVSTSIGEEGLDIPAVDAVIFYEPIPSAIRNIQRKGRTARMNFGEVIILVTKETKDETYLMISRMKERKMLEIVEQIKRDLESGHMRRAEQTRQSKL